MLKIRNGKHEKIMFTTKVLVILSIVCLALSGCSKGDDSAESAESESKTVKAEPVTLTVTSAMPENDFLAKGLTYFCDYVEKETDGQINFQIYYGGTYCSIFEEFNNVSTGTTDIAALMIAMSAQKIPLWCFPITGKDSADALRIGTEVAFENSETSKYLQDQMAEHNLVPLGYQAIGNSIFCAKKDFSTFEDLSSFVFGCTRDLDYFKALGLNAIVIDKSEAYESLSRGVVDATTTAISAYITGKYYEVAPYCVIKNGATSDALIVINNDRWNSFTADQQKVFMDAVVAVQKYEVDTLNASMDGYIKEIKDAGGSVKYLNDDDSLLSSKAEAQQLFNANMKFAENLLVEEQYKIICDTAISASGLGYSISK